MTFPGGGETVGEAYIRILADGSGLPHEIREEWRRHEPEFDEAGRRANRHFNEGWEDEQKKRPNNLGIIKDLRRQRGQFESVGSYLGGAAGRNLREQLERELGDKDIARRVFKNLSDEALRTRDTGVFTRGLTQNLAAEMDKAVRQIKAANEKTVNDDKKAAEERARLIESLTRRMEQADIKQGRTHAAALRENERRDKADADARARIIERLTTGLDRLERVAAKDRVRIAEGLNRDLIRLAVQRQETIDKLNRRVGRSDNRSFLQDVARDVARAREGDREAIARLEHLRTTTTRLISDGERGFLRLNGRMTQSVREASELERMFQRVHNRVEHMDLGRIFGRGARNNFVNLVGIAIGGFARLATRVALFPLERITRLGTDLHRAWTEGETFGQRMRGVASVLLGSLSRGLTSVTKLIPVMLGGLLALKAFAGPLAALISMLGGAISALAGSAILGLIGGIGALLPVMGVFAVGIGVMASALVGLDKKQKTLLKNRLGPITQDFKDLRKVSRDALFSDLPKQVPAIHRLLKNVIEPLFKSTGRAMAQSITAAVKVLDGPAMRKNFSALQTFAPQVIKRLGVIFTNTFTAMTGVMRAAVPLATRFLDSLVKASDHWSKLTNSASGQNKIRDALDKDYTSGQKLWQLFRNLIKVIRDIFTGGQTTGDSMLDSMNASLVRFDNFLRSGKGQKAMAGYFAAVQRFVGALGKFVGGIGKLFGSLDDPQSRQALNAILIMLGGMAKLISTVLPEMIPVLAPIGRALGAFFKLIADHAHAFAPLIAGLTALWIAMKVIKIGTSAFTAIDFFFATMNRRLGIGIGTTRSRIGQASRALSGAMIGLAGIVAGNNIGGGKGLAVSTGSGIIGGALFGSAFGPAGTGIGAAVGGIAGIVSHFWSQSSKDAEAAKLKHLAVVQAISDAADRLRGTLEQDNNAIRALTKGQLAADLQTPDKPGGRNALQAAQDQGIAPSLVVNAAAGSQKDFNALDTALRARESAISTAYRKWVTAHQSELQSGKLKLTDFAKQNPEFARTLTDMDLIRAKLKQERTAMVQSIKATDLHAAATGKLNLATRDLATQMFAYGKTIKGTSVAAQRNQAFVRDHTIALAGQSLALLKSGKSAAVAAKSYLTNRDALMKQLTAAGFAKDKVGELIAKYGKVPKEVLTALVANPTKANQGVLVALAKLKLLPPNVITKLLANPQNLSSNTIIAIAKLGLIPKSTLTKLLGNHSPLDSSTKAALRALGKLPYSKTVTLNAKGNLEAKITAITGQLNNIRGSTLNLYSTKGSAGATIHFGAAGGILNGATFVRPNVIGGEAGREALVPLDRPLSQVDPSVRALSAFARGLNNGPMTKMASGGIVGGGKTINVQPGAFTVVTPTTDPEAVAAEVFNRLAGGGYT